MNVAVQEIARLEVMKTSWLHAGNIHRRPCPNRCQYEVKLSSHAVFLGTNLPDTLTSHELFSNSSHKLLSSNVPINISYRTYKIISSPHSFDIESIHISFIDLKKLDFKTVAWVCAQYHTEWEFADQLGNVFGRHKVLMTFSSCIPWLSTDSAFSLPFPLITPDTNKTAKIPPTWFNFSSRAR